MMGILRNIIVADFFASKKDITNIVYAPMKELFILKSF